MNIITIVPYQPSWPAEFRALGGVLRGALGDLALRIDHIGSTSVPGLAAKDLIDIQATVAAFSPAVEATLAAIGYTRLVRITQDHVPPGGPFEPGEWVKWYFEPPAGQRPTHLHVRMPGRANQRYPLLFRDFLRARPAAAQAYAQVKMALAHYHADDKEAYYAVKDPACDIIMAGAEEWAAASRWEPGPSDC